MSASLRDTTSIQVNGLKNTVHIISILIVDSSIGSKLKGCWNDVKHQIKIDVERCGCNASSRKYSSISLMFALLVAGLFFGLLG